MTQIIKVTTTGDASLNQLLLRQTPGSKGRWGDNVFLINEDIRYCDWWFVCHGNALKQMETTICDPRHVVFVSMEPSEPGDPRFYRQFSKVIACDEYIKHPSIIPINISTWWAGIEVDFENGHIFKPTVNYDYDSLSALKVPEKLNRISIITSNNNHLPGHQARLNFIEKLKKSSLADMIDIYGGGHNPIPDKIDALLPYKYHIALENSRINNYWTEKIGDSFLGAAMPIYYGCPNIQEYFPSKSLVEIDILAAEESIEKISIAIHENLHEKYLDEINEARALILNKYNIFQVFSDLASPNKQSSSIPYSISPPHQFSSAKNRIFLSKARRMASTICQQPYNKRSYR